MTSPTASGLRLSAVISVHDEEAQLADCLEGLSFADEIVVLLDDCTDRSGEIATRFTDRVIDGAWDIEGERRNAGIEACRGTWMGLGPMGWGIVGIIVAIFWRPAGVRQTSRGDRSPSAGKGMSIQAM